MVKFTYSKIVSVSSNTKKSSVKIYPNPTHDLLTIDLQNIGNQNITLDVTDAFGRLYFQKLFKQSSPLSSQIFYLRAFIS